MYLIRILKMCCNCLVFCCATYSVIRTFSMTGDRNQHSAAIHIIPGKMFSVSVLKYNSFPTLLLSILVY